MKNKSVVSSNSAQQWILFIVLAVISCLVTLIGNVHYGLIEQKRFGSDLAKSILADPHDYDAPQDHLSSVMRLHHDVIEISVCNASLCRSVREPSASMETCGTGVFPSLLCVRQIDPRERGRSVEVKFLPDDSYRDAYRDMAMVLLAQLFGMLVWYSATRRNRESLKQAESSLRVAASQDYLTGLGNRFALDVAIQDALQRACSDCWLIYMDLDDFKLINDTRGHEIGDQILRETARRLCGFVMPATVARLGGDEFAVLISGKSRSQLEYFTEELQTLLNKPYSIVGKKFSVSASIGISPVHFNGASATEVRRRADVALYEAKRLGKARTSFFDEKIDRRKQFEYQLLEDFQSAIPTSQVYFHYQPIVSPHGSLCGLEALARWEHPTLGTVSPAVFIPLAEESGLILELGSKAISDGCRDLAFIRRLGLDVRFVSINVSAQQLIGSGLVNDLRSNLMANDLAPSDLMLEITESLAMAHDRSGSQRLTELAAAGFSIAIDDFGTGYSSLARLQSLPVKKLKIDRAFIRMMDTESGVALVETMLELAGKLGMSCVAEGVETESQRDLLTLKGCEMFQGFLYGKAMSPKELVEWAALRSVGTEGGLPSRSAESGSLQHSRLAESQQMPVTHAAVALQNVPPTCGAP